MHISKILAEYAKNLEYGDLPERCINEAKRRLIDSLGCGIGTYNEESIRYIRQLSSVFANPEGATILGTRIKVSPDYAAFSNGYAIRYLDWNDTYLSLEPAHPSDNISGILAIGETERSSGKEILLSIVLAYEIQCRLCDIASLRSKGWDHVNYLLISSVLAISKLMNHSLKKMEESVKIVLNNLSTRQNRIGELSNWKAAAASNAVRNAVFSAKLSKAGLTGPSEIFEGKYGFQNQVSGEFNIDIKKFGMKGRDFLLPETYLKKHNAEYHAQSSIEAALELRTQLKDIDEIESLIIETHEAGFTIIGDKEKDPDKWDPKTRETADHSLPYTTVTSLIDGEITEKQYEMNKIRDVNSLDLIKRVKVIENPEFTKSYPKEGIINKVTISLKNGDRLSSQIDFPKGHPMNPMVDHEVEEKFNKLTKAFLSKKNREEILQVIWNLENVREIWKIFHLSEIN